MHRKLLTYNNSRIYYETEGNGPPVMFVHGFGEDGRVWHYQRAFLKSHFHLIIPDLPGSGKSDLLSVPAERTASMIEMYADSMKQVLDRENIKQCTLIGHSMGGYVALAFAQHYPERLNALGLVHSTAFADNEDKKATRRKGIAFIQRYGAQEFLKQSIPNLFGSAFTLQHPEQIETLMKDAGNFTAAALVQYYGAMIKRPDRTETLKKLTIPVLFIIGEEDKSVSLEDSLKQCYLPAKAFINILPDTAHMGMWERKDQANDTVMKFLNYVCDA
ncbi:alpha/beta hydrolase [Agriterribacter sp.]|uniref:alpha/beta fold hydrolase n=1 Tax=Agriterribacter sp. TaxID=2821509 RepID=UPI002BCC5D15|nr:alpha/beta hydrolase [Agriterribacter sp.]HRO45480.1 alpha/beta hydrolase [Agriterribacter sp.]HRQ19398.1 alpha/beta hydrolase [Agriterribacter sp.]